VSGHIKKNPLYLVTETDPVSELLLLERIQDDWQRLKYLPWFCVHPHERYYIWHNEYLFTSSSRWNIYSIFVLWLFCSGIWMF